MKRFSLLMLLSLALCQGARSQGARYDNFVLKPLNTGGLTSVSGALITVCTSAGTGTPCTPKVANIYSDEALTTPITGTGGAGTTNSDSNGNFGFYLAPGSYVYTITGTGVTSSTTKITLPCGAATSCNTVSTISKLNNIFYVDGTTYALTDVGVNAAITAAAAQGGGKVMITKPITATGNINLASKVQVECTGWETSPITWAGGVGPNAIFVGGVISDAAVRGCSLKGPNMAATPIPVLTTSTAGGSLAAGITVFVKTTYVNGSGETLASTEGSIVTGAGATNSVTVQAPWTAVGLTAPPIPATGYTVYSSTTTNTEKQQAASANCVNITTNCIIQTIGAGANAPATTTAAVNIDLRGIEIDGLSRSFVEYNKVTGMSYCIFETSGGQDMQINHNFVQSCTLQGIVTYDSHVAAKFNRIDTIGTTNLHHGIYNSGGTDILDEGNHITNVTGFCVQVFASSSPQVNNEVRIIGNSCEVGGQAPSGPRGGYLSQYNSPGGAPNKIIMADNIAETLGGDRCLGLGDVTDASVHDNICKNFGPGEGFYITPTQGTGIQNLDVHDNIFNGNTSTGNGINCNQGTGGVSNFTIHNNILLNIRAIGIEVLGCNDGTISGNTIKNFNLAAAFASGITIDTPTTGVTVSGNRIRSTAANGNCLTVIAGATDNVIYGNIDLNCTAALADAGTRTIIFGEKVNATDNNFQLSALGSKVVLPGATSGSVTLAVPAVAGANTATFPANVGTVAELNLAQSYSANQNFPGNTAALTADWTCGTAGTVSSCVAATIIGSGGGVPLTFTLPSVAQSYTLECDGVVGQATAVTANQWNLLTATNGATNVTASYSMTTAATAAAFGAVTDQASTTTTFQIAPSWTLGAIGTKMPFHIYAKIEGASASGTVVSLQLVAPTVADLVTIYRGASCRVF